MLVFGKHVVVRGFLAAAALLAIVWRLPAALPAAAAPLLTMTDASLGATRQSPEGIVVGPDGNFWITMEVANTIVRLTPGGAMTPFLIPTTGAEPMELTVGPDGNMWFAEYGPVGQLGRITPAGTITEFPVKSATPDSRLWSVVAGPDGNLWYTNFTGHAIGRMARDGSGSVEFPTPLTLADPADITVGPDNNIWFTEWGGDQIGRLTIATGQIQEFPLAPDSGPIGITKGPDGALWFVESGANKVGRITVDGVITEYHVPTPETGWKSGPVELAVGPDGLIWICEGKASKIASMTLDGQFSEYVTPTPNSFPDGLVIGPDGRLWFIADGADRYGVLDIATHFARLPLVAH